MSVNSNQLSEDEVQENRVFEVENEQSLESLPRKSQIKSYHTICSLDRWATLSCSCQVDERIDHYKRLLEEGEQRIQTREELIATLQNQLRKLEMKCQKSFENTEHYRFKFCVLSKEIENLKKICSQYKENIETLMKINADLVSKEDLQRAQKESESWKLKCQELQQLINLKQVPNNSKSTETNVNTADLEEQLSLLKKQCSGIEELLQAQNSNIANVIKQYLKDLTNNKDENANATKLPEGILQDISIKTTNHSESLQIILDENKSIKAELLNFEKQLLEMPMIKNTDTTIQTGRRCRCKKDTEFIIFQEIQTDVTGDGTEKLLAEIEELKKVSEYNDEYYDTAIKNLNHNIDTIEREKLKMIEKYEELLANNDFVNNELQSKILQLKKSTDKINKLTETIQELQKSLEVATKENKNQLQSKENGKSEEFVKMQELLQQYKEQVEFKRLENEKLRKREKDLELEVQKNQYEVEQAAKEAAAIGGKQNVAVTELQTRFDDLLNDSKKKEAQLIAENNEILNLLQAKNKEINQLKSQTTELRNNINVVQNEAQKLENANDKSLTEISCLYKHKENEWLEITHKFTEQQDYVSDLEEQNAELKNQLKELQEKLKLNLNSEWYCDENSCSNRKIQLLTLLHNTENTLMQIIEEGEDINVEPHTIDEFLHQTRRFIALVEQVKSLDVEPKEKNEDTNVLALKNANISQNVDDYSVISNKSQCKDTSRCRFSATELILSENKLLITMKQLLDRLEEMKKGMKNSQLTGRNDPFKSYYDSNSQNDSLSISVIESLERSLDTIEEELENQVHEDDEQTYYYPRNPKGERLVCTCKPCKARPPEIPQTHYNCPCAWCAEERWRPKKCNRPSRPLSEVS